MPRLARGIKCQSKRSSESTGQVPIFICVLFRVFRSFSAAVVIGVVDSMASKGCCELPIEKAQTKPMTVKVSGCLIRFLLFLIMRFSLHQGSNRHCSILLRKAICTQPCKLNIGGLGSIFPKNSKHNYILTCRDLVHSLSWEALHHPGKSDASGL